MAKCLRCGAGSEWIQGQIKAEVPEAATPYLDALQRYSDAWYNLAIDYGMKASVASAHAKHVQDAINGLRSVLREHS